MFLSALMMMEQVQGQPEPYCKMELIRFKQRCQSTLLEEKLVDPQTFWPMAHMVLVYRII